MRYRGIPKTDLRVSTICLGTAPVGSHVGEEEAFRILDQFIDHGGNFIDTARAYAIWVPGGEGISESVIGKWLKTRGHKNSVIVATKGGHPAWEAMQVPRLSREEIWRDCDLSLSALGIDSIPLYWLHRDDTSRPLSDIFETLETLRQHGKIRYYGFSNWSTERMREALALAQEHGLAGFVANQPMWSLAEVNPAGIADSTSYAMDEEMHAFHAETGLPVIPYTSQARGLFSKWAWDGLNGLDPNLRKAYDNSTNRARFDKVKRLSEETGHSITALSIAWLTSQPEFITIPIVWGNSTQLSDVLAASDVELPRQLLEFLK